MAKQQRQVPQERGPAASTTAADRHAEEDGQGKSFLPGPKLRHVAILLATSGSYVRGILRGVARYNREHAHWSTFFHPQLHDAPPPWLKDWHGDGILARIGTPAYAKSLQKMHVPVVNLRLPFAQLPFPYVGIDHAKIAEVAAEHLLSKGMRHFGFYGSEPGIHAGLDERARAFQQTIAAANRTCGVLTVGGGADERDWEHEQQRLAVWVQSLPKPVGIMASNDERGLQVLDACRRVGLHVPDEVAVIGVDNDELLCDLAVPPLTSIDVNGEQIGYQAAATLDKMMAGEESIPESAQFGPRGVVTRRSTDVIASEDPEVNRAISFIRENAARPLSVIDVLAHLNMSRAALQTRMKHVLGHTIHQEIERVRLTRAKELLATSDMTIKQVTHLTGFSSVQYMTRVFRAVVGETPAIFRKQRRG